MMHTIYSEDLTCNGNIVKQGEILTTVKDMMMKILHLKLRI